jgi:hypothetical protein
MNSTGTGPAQAAGPAGTRPSPRPRPRMNQQQPRPAAATAAPAPAPALQKVTESNSPVSSLHPAESAPAPIQPQENGPESLQSPVKSPLDVDTLRERLREAIVAVRAYLTPPSVWTEQPASMAELAAYARWGAWTNSTGLRRAGLCWHWLVSLPVTTICRYGEWIAQRPGRLIPVYVLWKLLISTGPGPWAADHLVRPLLGLAAWVLL